MWTIWRERNLQNFDGHERSIIQLKSQLLGFLTFFEWHWQHVYSSAAESELDILAYLDRLYFA